MKKTYFTNKIISSKRVAELDFETLNHIPDFDENEEESHEIIGNGQMIEPSPIEIDRLIEMLKENKEKGSTHVCIETDVDHFGYELFFTEIRRSNDQEIAEYQQEMLKLKEKQKKLKEIHLKSIKKY